MSATMKHRPIFGGVFGMGRYALATLPCISRGLHAVRYMVIEPAAGSVLSVAEDKTAALSAARRVLRAALSLDRQQPTQRPEQGTLWPVEALPVDHAGTPSKATRRRRAIFNACGGRCHYCGTALTLDGRWHVEHQMPKALGGDDDPTNLVAACAPCNLSKRDRTAVEFIVDLQGRLSRTPKT